MLTDYQARVIDKATNNNRGNDLEWRAMLKKCGKLRHQHSVQIDGKDAQERSLSGLGSIMGEIRNNTTVQAEWKNILLFICQLTRVQLT